MTLDDAALRVADALNAAGILLMLVGGFSSNDCRFPLSTKDADFVIQLNAPLNERIARTRGREFEAEPQMAFATNTGTLRQEFRVKGTMFKVEIFRLSNDTEDQERFRRRQRAELEGRQIFFPTPEGVIIGKLRWARAKDREDVRAVIGVEQARFDWPCIENWCERHGTRALLEQILRTVPKTWPMGRAQP